MRSQRGAGWGTKAFRSGAWHVGPRHRAAAGALRRAARSLGVLVPRRGVAAGGARRAGRRARLRRARAHRSRRRVRLARVRDTRRSTSESAPITGAEVTVEGGTHVTLLCETQGGYANLCRILTDAHAGTRPEGKEHRELLPAATTIEDDRRACRGARRLSGCARHGSGTATRPAPRASRRRFRVRSTSSCSVRTSGATRDGTHSCSSSRTHLGVPTVATGDVHAHHERRAELQDALVAIRHRTSLDGSERERRGNHESVLQSPAAMLERLPRDAALRTREVADRCRFDLTQELGYRYPDFSDGPSPADVQLREICERAFAERYADANGLKRRARERLDGELQLIAPARPERASSCCTGRCSSSRASARSRYAVPAALDTCCRRGAAAARASARSSAT